MPSKSHALPSVFLCVLCAFAVTLLLSLLPVNAQDDNASIVANGKIAFASNMDGDFEIYTINPDGSDLQRLTFNETDDVAPDWSPDGQRIAFLSNRDDLLELYVMDANGSHQSRLLANQVAQNVDWSPDGTQLIFNSPAYSGLPQDIFKIDADGDSLVNLTNGVFELNISPFWSPDGNFIYFLSTEDRPVDRDLNLFTLHRMNSDGSNLVNLFYVGGSLSSIDIDPTNNLILFDQSLLVAALIVHNLGSSIETRLTDGVEYSSGNPAWSPDGTKIVYIGADGIMTMNADGSESQTILPRDTTQHFSYRDPDWQPIFPDTIIPTATP